MELYNEILKYLEIHGNPSSHEFKNGTKVVGIPLKNFLLEWYNQAVLEYKEYGTLNNVAALKKLIN